jgi:hypothetical protein
MALWPAAGQRALKVLDGLLPPSARAALAMAPPEAAHRGSATGPGRLRLIQFQAPDDYPERRNERIGRLQKATAGLGVLGATQGDLWTACELAGG